MFLISFTMRSSVSTNSCVEDLSSCEIHELQRTSARTYQAVVRLHERLSELLCVELGARIPAAREPSPARLDGAQEVLWPSAPSLALSLTFIAARAQPGGGSSLPGQTLMQVAGDSRSELRSKGDGNWQRDVCELPGPHLSATRSTVRVRQGPFRGLAYPGGLRYDRVPRDSLFTPTKIMPYRVEYAASARSGCSGPVPCSKTKIAKGALRFGTVVTIGGNTSYKWRHWYVHPLQRALLSI